MTTNIAASASPWNSANLWNSTRLAQTRSPEVGAPAQDGGATLTEAPDGGEALQQAAQGVVVNIGGADASSEDVTYDSPKLMARKQLYQWLTPEQEAEHTALENRLTGRSVEFQKIESAWSQLKQSVAALYPKMTMDFGFTLSEDGKIIITNGTTKLTDSQRKIIEHLANKSEELTSNANVYASEIIDYVKNDRASLVGYQLDKKNFKDVMNLGEFFNKDEIVVAKHKKVMQKMYKNISMNAKDIQTEFDWASSPTLWQKQVMSKAKRSALEGPLVPIKDLG